MWIDEDYEETLGLGVRDTEPPSNEDDPTPVVEVKGTNCRSCGNYNHYMPADLVVLDNKHTCYNCITSPYRWNKNIPKKNIKKLKEYYKHIFKNNKPFNFDY